MMSDRDRDGVNRRDGRNHDQYDRGGYGRDYSHRNDVGRVHDDYNREDGRRYDRGEHRNGNGNGRNSEYMNGQEAQRRYDSDDRRYKRPRTDTTASPPPPPPPPQTVAASTPTPAPSSSLFRSSTPSDHLSVAASARHHASLLLNSQTSAPARPLFLSREERQKFALERQNGRRTEHEAKAAAIIQGAVPKTSSLVTLSASASNDVVISDKERALIRATYLGGGNNADTVGHRRSALVTGPKGKPKFAFEWAAADDTAAEAIALFDNKVNVAPMYGRAAIGGIDKTEQRETRTQYEETALQTLKQTIAAGNDMLIDKPIDLSSHATSNRSHKAHAKDHYLSTSEHWSSKSLAEMSDRDWRIFKEDFEISTRGGGRRVPNPLRSWNESGLPPSLLQTLTAVGYTEPSPIQRAAIPVGLANLDVIGIAETGSGKTAAFLIPMFVFIDKLPRLTPITAEAGPYAIVMAPSRELAQQISSECTKLSQSLGIRNVCIIGGQSIEEQALSLRNGVEIVIATPGRIYDCIVKRYLVLQQCNYIVLDEADRMIDMNFEPQIINIMEAMPPADVRPDYDANTNMTDITTTTTVTTAEQMPPSAPPPRKTHYRQTIMFSATMPSKVENLAKKYLYRPVTIQIGDKAGAASTNVEQRIIWIISDHSRRTAFKDALLREPPPIIVFCNYKRICDEVATICDNLSLSNVVLHGSKTQDIRENALKTFRDGLIDVIVATDVMGRGIDIKNIRHVINYEMPDSIEKYTHRIGRTGRAGNKGVATSFLSEADTAIMFDLKALLIAADQPVPPQLAAHDAAKVKPGTVTDKPKSKIVFAK